jgi:hypothetical protein
LVRTVTILFQYYRFDTIPLPLDVVALYLRLGTKYDMAKFRKKAVELLAYEFPATLEEFDMIDHYSKIEECSSPAEELFIVIELAHKHNLPRVLPWAYTAVCQNLFEEIFESIGSAQLSLSPKDQQKCVFGWRALIRMQRRTTFAWLTASNKTYSPCRREFCRDGRQDILMDNFYPSEDPSGRLQPSHSECIPLEEWNQKWEDRMCEHCIKVAKGLHQDGRQKMWDALPSIFGLPEWAELTK